MLRAFLDRLLVSPPPGKYGELVEQAASGIRFNTRHGGQRALDQGYQEGVIEAKNCLIVLLNHLPLA